MKLPRTFYTQCDVVAVAKGLLGKVLYTQDDNGCITGGVIIETEGYAGAQDRASHAYKNRRTKRTEVLFREGGVAYIYLCYGLHYLMNVVTNQIEIPHAVLIRALHPLIGIPLMQKRRKTDNIALLSAGPGTLSVAMGITKAHHGVDLRGSQLWIEDAKISFVEEEICSGPRIGIDYAGADAALPWRFWLASGVHPRLSSIFTSL